MNTHAPLDLGEVVRTPVDDRTKGFPALPAPVPLSGVEGLGLSLPDLQPPVMVLREAALAHNLALMAEFCRTHGVDLAPHGKTSMAPQLWARQLAAGAWGITAATVAQARVMRAVGVRRILIANELVDAPSIAWVAEQLSDPSLELLCYVDSARGVSILADRLRALGAARPLRVLVELGHAGGRTGCRSVAEAVEVAGLVGSAPSLRVAGVAGYEGTVCGARSPACLAAVASFLEELRALALALIDADAFADAEEIMVTAGGSAFFDVVIDRLRQEWPAGASIRVVLRSGCYLTHDSGIYARLSPLSATDDPARGFQPAIDVWGSVLSRPEPDLAILGLGRRDVPFDQGLPVPHTARVPSGETVDITGRLEIVSLNDQHAFCRVGAIGAARQIEVGDLIGCGVSHPCTAFDKWRVIPVLDEDARVVDAVATFF